MKQDDNNPSNGHNESSGSQNDSSRCSTTNTRNLSKGRVKNRRLLRRFRQNSDGLIGKDDSGSNRLMVMDNASEQQNSTSDTGTDDRQLERLHDLGWSAPNTPTPSRTSSATPSRTNSATPSRTNSIMTNQSSTSSRVQINELEDKSKAKASAAAANAQAAVVRSPTTALGGGSSGGSRRGSSSSSNANAITRLQLQDMEDKAMAMNSNNRYQMMTKRLSSRKEMKELEQEKKLYAQTKITDSLVKRTPLSELESDKKPGDKGGGALVEIPRTRPATTDELEMEKKAASKGFAATARDSLSASLRSRRLMRGNRKTNSQAKMLNDSSGRGVNLELEFNRLHPTNVEILDELEEPDIGESIRCTPGAIAVFGEEYFDSDDDDQDFINPDNFDAEDARRQEPLDALREIEVESGKDDSSVDSRRMQTAAVTNVFGEEEEEQVAADGQNKRFPFQKERSLCVPIIAGIVLIAAIAVGLGVGLSKGKSKATAPTFPLGPTSQPSMPPEPSVSPSNPFPSVSVIPSTSPSLAPTRSFWETTGVIQGNQFGREVCLIDNFMALTDSTSVRTFELTTAWAQVGQALPGDSVQLAQTQRIAIRNNGNIQAYDLVNGVWTQIGLNITTDFIPDTFAISGDGSTIALASITYRGYRLLLYRLINDAWGQLGRSIIENDDIGLVPPFIETKLSYDGNIVGAGIAIEDPIERGYVQLFQIEVGTTTFWSPLLGEGNFLAGGPQFDMNDDGVIVVTSTASTVQVYEAITRQPIGPPIPIQLRNPSTALVISMTEEGTRFAYSIDDQLYVLELSEEDNAWVPKGSVETTTNQIMSISISDSGGLAVGQPDGNVVEILELPSETVPID